MGFVYLPGPSPVPDPTSNKIQTTHHALASLTSPLVLFPIPLPLIHSTLVTMSSCSSSNKPCSLASQSLCTVCMAPPPNILEACSFISSRPYSWKIPTESCTCSSPHVGSELPLVYCLFMIIPSNQRYPVFHTFCLSFIFDQTVFFYSICVCLLLLL